MSLNVTDGVGVIKQSRMCHPNLLQYGSVGRRVEGGNVLGLQLFPKVSHVFIL